MQKTESKLILYLLLNPANIGKTYRIISDEAGVSLGSVQSNIAILMEKGFVVESALGRLLRKRERLLDYWARGYAEDIKKKLFIGRFRFLTPSVKENWQEINLGSDAFWGGEPAAFLLDGYLKPERWDVYVEENADCLIKTRRMVSDPEGNIFVYKKFWNTEGVPPVVVYADLLSIDDDRCREAAMRIKEDL